MESRVVFICLEYKEPYIPAGETREGGGGSTCYDKSHDLITPTLYKTHRSSATSWSHLFQWWSYPRWMMCHQNTTTAGQNKMNNNRIQDTPSVSTNEPDLRPVRSCPRRHRVIEQTDCRLQSKWYLISTSGMTFQSISSSCPCRGSSIWNWRT